MWREKSELLLLINFESLPVVLQMSLKSLVFPVFQLVPEGPENILQNMIVSGRVKQSSKTRFLSILKHQNVLFFVSPSGITGNILLKGIYVCCLCY